MNRIFKLTEMYGYTQDIETFTSTGNGMVWELLCARVFSPVTLWYISSYVESGSRIQPGSEFGSATLSGLDVCILNFVFLYSQ